MTTTTQTGGAFSGLFDSVGSFLRDAAPAAADYFVAKEQAKAAEAAAKAQAEAAKLAAKANGTASGSPGGGGFPPQYILYGVAGAIGLGVIYWAATRK